MRNKWIVIALVVAVPVIAFVAVYLAFFNRSAPAKLSLSNETAPSAAPIADPSGRWVVAAGSQAGYRVREKLARLPAKDDAVGRTSAITGGLVVERAADASLGAKDLDFTADLSQLRSDEQRRDNRIRIQGLESDRYPQATFTAAGPIAVPAALNTGAAATVSVTGDLTIHGVKRTVTIPLQVRMTGGRAEVAGSLTFPFTEFGMEPPSIPPFVSVDPDATMELKLLLRKAA